MRSAVRAANDAEEIARRPVTGGGVQGHVQRQRVALPATHSPVLTRMLLTIDILFSFFGLLDPVRPAPALAACAGPAAPGGLHTLIEPAAFTRGQPTRTRSLNPRRGARDTCVCVA